MLAIGLMSGTSMDGVDAALLDTDGEYAIERLAECSIDYDPIFKSALKQQTRESINPDIIKQSTQYHADAIKLILHKFKSHNINHNNISIIGYHGQTIYHNAHEKISLQIGDPQYLADLFSIPVIFNFRQNDMLHGGQGAPLAPLYHHALMIQKNLDNLAIINIGGIANISVLTHDKILAGFDTGPGNILIDRFVSDKTNQQYAYDNNGEWAQHGIIHTHFLEKLYQDNRQYFSAPPPKSLDINHIISPDLYHEILNQLSLVDGCATLTAFTAMTISHVINKHIKNIILCGGGTKNLFLVQALKHYLPTHLIQTADEIQWNSTYMEAELFAWLAVRSVKKLPLSRPETTGVDYPVTGGDLFLPKNFTGI